MKHRLSLFIFSMLLFSVSGYSQLQKIYTLAGNGYAGFSGDGNNASGAMLWGPIGVAVDATGNMYIADYLNDRVRKVNTAGLITTIAGTGIGGNTGDGSIGSSAEIIPQSVAVDAHGNIYISDAASSVIRKVNALGIISRVAGTGVPGYSGDGGAALSAKLFAPCGIAFDSKGNLYIADEGNHVVREVDTSGKIFTVAGSNVAGYSGDGSPAVLATLDSPYAVAVDRTGNLFIDDYGNNVIRVVYAATGYINTYAGTGAYAYNGDMGFAVIAALDEPRGLAVDTFGNLYISDAGNSVIRKVNATTGIITTVAGNGTPGFGGDLGYAIGANLFNPYGVAVDVYGNIFIADANNERIRKVYYPTLGIGNVAAAGGIAVYPNPVNGSITVSGLEASDRVCVYDIIGRQVSGVWQVSSNDPQTFDVSNLAPGVYLLKVSDADGANVDVRRLIKQ